MKSKPRFVQVRNPRTKEWVRVDTAKGRIAGRRRKPYRCPKAGEAAEGVH